MKAALIALGAITALILLFIFLPVVAWILVGLVLLILAVVLLVPVGADIAYVGGEFRLAARADGLAIQLLPRKPRDPNKPPKEKKPRKEKEKKEEAPAEQAPKPKRKLDFTFDEILELLKKVINGLGKFGRLTVRKFMLHYTATGEDPYDTAMLYGGVNTALCVLGPICARKFNVTGDVDVRTEVDFAAEKTRLDFELSVTLRLIQAVHAGLAAGFGALGVLFRHWLRKRRERRLNPETEPVPDGASRQEEAAEQADNRELKESIQAEERKDLHG